MKSNFTYQDMEFSDHEEPMSEDKMLVRATPPSFKASAILYSMSAVVLTLSFLIVMVDLASRQGTAPDTMIEMLEWNNFSQLGVIGACNSALFFWLGLMSDRRGA